MVSVVAAVWRMLPTRAASAQTRGTGELDLRTNMKAAWYEKQGRCTGRAGRWQNRRSAATHRRGEHSRCLSGVNPGDVKKREDSFGVGMPYPRVIRHSDGSGTVDAVGEGVSREWIGRRVWCYGAQSYRPFGTSAEYTVVPLKSW